MSGFVINPYAFGGAVGGLTTIDLSASPTQAQLDVDMTGYDELEVWLEGATNTGSTVPKIRLSNDGGSTFKTASGDYHETLGYLGESITTTGLRAWGIDNATIANMHTHTRLAGFNRAGRGVVLIGGYARTAGGTPQFSNYRAHSNFDNCNYVRLGTLANWGTSGKIYYRRIAWSSFVDMGSHDWSVSTSGTTFFSAGSANEAFFRNVATRNSGASSRADVRVSLNGTSFLSGASDYQYWGYDQNSPTGGLSIISHSANNTAVKYTSGWFCGLNSSVELYYTGGGFNNNNGTIQSGYVDQTSPVTHVGWSGFLAGVNYNEGVTSGFGRVWANRANGTVSISPSNTEFVVPVGGNYENGNIHFDKGNFCSADSRVYITVSTDNGVTYKSAGYVTANDDDGILTSASQMRTGIHSGTAVNTGSFQISGIQNGARFTMTGGGDWIGDNSNFFGMWKGGTEQVTHIKFALASGNWDTAWTAHYRFWN